MEKLIARHFIINLREEPYNAGESNANITAETAIGFAEWLLSNYNTSEEGMSLCWVNADVDIRTKHDTDELFTIYINQL